MNARRRTTAVAAIAAALIVSRSQQRVGRNEDTDSSDLEPAPGATFASLATGRTHYHDQGHGPPMLLIHGSGRSFADWRGVTEHLHERRRVVTLDLYGCGRSERDPTYRYGYQLWIAQMIGLLDDLRIDTATVVGNSLGGMLACLLAAQHPTRVDQVITLGTGLSIDPQQILMILPRIGASWLARLDLTRPAIDETHRRELELAYRVRGTRAGFLAYARRQAFIDGPRLLRHSLAAEGVIITHLSAPDDHSISTAATRRLAVRTGGNVVVLPRGSHYAHLTHPAEIAELISPVRS